MMSIITTELLSRNYGTRVGIDAVNLEIGEGEIFGFLGPNGAGKTTTIRLLLGFLRPTLGRASIGGLDCWLESPRIKREVGYLPGDLRLYPWLTGQTALKIIGRVRNVDLREDGADLADRFQLEMDLRVRKMSRGMRQKLGLIMALVHKPRLLILDEPTAGLDPLMQAELANHLRELRAAGHTVFFSSHTLSEVESLCDRVAIVRQGHIIADETLESLRGRARRIVELVFPDGETAARVQLPDFLKLNRRDGCQCYCELAGPTPPLICWAGQQAIEDISISQPDLESLFRKFYESSLEPQ
ncbi:MAG TPA: ABC transporter ATP-binding protein [Pirellulaceae bacterium]|jgi:ABC-2 type transport system ATP-binding protein|nr:ABC transporter ATP-binding protein [Pirellulaceae bacterium]